jgi:hypothetical protein
MLLPKHATIIFKAGRFVVRPLDFVGTDVDGSCMISEEERFLDVGTVLKFGNEGAGEAIVIAKVAEMFAGEPSKFEPNLGCCRLG